MPVQLSLFVFYRNSQTRCQTFLFMLYDSKISQLFFMLFLKKQNTLNNYRTGNLLYCCSIGTISKIRFFIFQEITPPTEHTMKIV